MIVEVKLGISQHIRRSDEFRRRVATHVWLKIRPDAVKYAPSEYVVEIRVCEGGCPYAANRASTLLGAESVYKPPR